MKAIISMVLAQEEAVGRAASAYIDNVYITEDVVPATRVHLNIWPSLGWNARTQNGWRMAHRY